MVTIGYIKGYDFCVVTKKKLEKEEFLSELINENPNIKEEMRSVLDNNGYIIGLTKKKVLKLAYLFDLNEKVLTFRNKILTKEINEKIEQKFDKIIIEELKEKLIFDELEKIDFDDIEIKSKKKAGFSLLVFICCVGLGSIFGNIGLGMLWGFILGITFGVAIANKKDDKKS